MTEEPQFYLIPKEMLAGLLAYLGRRPFGEVAAAMRALEQLQPASKSEVQGEAEPEPAAPED